MKPNGNMTTYNYPTGTRQKNVLSGGRQQGRAHYRAAARLSQLIAHVPQLIPKLSDRLHVIAPDYIGFGYSDAPSPKDFQYTFDNLAEHVEELLFNVLGLKKFSIYAQDYGAPIGYRIASKHPNAVTPLWFKTAMPMWRGLAKH